MIGNSLQRFFPRVGSSGAVPKTDRTLSTSMAPRPARMPQSQPMQRSVGTHVSDSESSSPGSSPSDDDLIFESVESTYSYPEPLLIHLPNTLHNPLNSSDPALLRTAVLDSPLTFRCRRDTIQLIYQTRRKPILHTIRPTLIRGLHRR
jgi:hypothetical protein